MPDHSGGKVVATAILILNGMARVERIDPSAGHAVHDGRTEIGYAARSAQQYPVEQPGSKGSQPHTNRQQQGDGARSVPQLSCLVSLRSD